MTSPRIIHPSPEGQALVAQVQAQLMVVQGHVMTNEVAEERARNIAAALMATYRMAMRCCPRCEWALPDCRCVARAEEIAEELGRVTTREETSR